MSNTKRDIVEERLVSQLERCIEYAILQNRKKFPELQFQEVPGIKYNLDTIVRLEIHQIPKMNSFNGKAKKHITDAVASIIPYYIRLASDLFKDSEENKKNLWWRLGLNILTVAVATYLFVEVYYSGNYNTNFYNELRNENWEFLRQNAPFLEKVLLVSISASLVPFSYLEGIFPKSIIAKGARPQARKKFYQEREELFKTVREAYREATNYAKT